MDDAKCNYRPGLPAIWRRLSALDPDSIIGMDALREYDPQVRYRSGVVAFRLARPIMHGPQASGGSRFCTPPGVSSHTGPAALPPPSPSQVVLLAGGINEVPGGGIAADHHITAGGPSHSPENATALLGRDAVDRWLLDYELFIRELQASYPSATIIQVIVRRPRLGRLGCPAVIGMLH